MSARSLPPIEIDSTADGDRATVIPDEPVRPALFTVTDPSDLHDAPPASRMPTAAPPRNIHALDDLTFEPPSDIVPARARITPELAPDATQRSKKPEWMSTTAVSAGVEPSTQEREEDSMAILGSLDAIPHHAVAPDQLTKLRLDHHAGFMLALVDGVLSFETIVDVCGMKRPEALRVLSFLIRKGVIAV